jgi:transposase
MAYLAEHPAIHVEWLPPCAPDINPEEFCHGNVKTRMKNAMPLNRELDFCGKLKYRLGNKDYYWNQNLTSASLQ